MTYTENIVENAAAICVLAHRDQTRKNDDTPYAMHPVSVALTLAKYQFPDAVIAAALTHDVLEDTDFPAEELKEAIGDVAYELVVSVSHTPGNSWEDQREEYIKQVRAGSPFTKAISVADKIANLRNLLAAYALTGPDLWRKFNRGRDKKLWFEEAMLAMLKETWEHPLVDEYELLVNQMKALD